MRGDVMIKVMRGCVEWVKVGHSCLPAAALRLD